LILNAKCHAIRDAQLIEKVEIKKELLSEDKRLDEMMEVERIKALQEYEEREKRKQSERLEGAKVLRDQIKDNTQNKMLEEERKDQETAVSQHLLLKILILIDYFYEILKGASFLFFVAFSIKGE